MPLNPEEYDDDVDGLLDAAQSRVQAGQTMPAWMAGIKLTEKGHIPRTLTALVQVLTQHPALASRLAYNVRTNELRCLAETPWRAAGAIDDPWITELQLYLEAQCGASWGTETVYRATQAVCHRSSYDPVEQYLRGLTWDGERRLDDLLIRYAGAEDTELTRAMTRCWMISAVQRVLQPGCQADHVLILEGRQGVGKTSLLRTLAGDGYHAEGRPALDDKAGSEVLQGPWIYELGEMGVLNRHDSEAVKQWITQRVDRYRAAYARLATDHPRRVIFAGSTNEARYLRDATGGRRWWPVHVGLVDTHAVGDLRDQLWGEATTAALTGEPHWLRGDAADAAESAQKARVIADPWEEEIGAHIAARSAEGGELVRMSSHDVWEVLGIPVERRGGQTGQRVAAVMKALRWQPWRDRDGRGWERMP